MTRWPSHFSWSNPAANLPMSAVATIGTGLSSGCKKLGNDTRFARRSHIPTAILHKPSRTQERDRYGQVADRVFDNGMLSQQVYFAGLCSDSREINNALRTRCGERGVEGPSNFVGLRKFRRGIKVWRDEHKDRFCSLKGNVERDPILYCGKSHLATQVPPDLTFVDIPHDRPHRLAGC